MLGFAPLASITLGDDGATSTQNDLFANDITTGSPVNGASIVTQDQQFLANGIVTGLPTNGSSTLVQDQALAPVAITTGNPTLGTSALAITSVLTASGITTGSPTLGNPTVTITQPPLFPMTSRQETLLSAVLHCLSQGTFLHKVSLQVILL